MSLGSTRGQRGGAAVVVFLLLQVAGTARADNCGSLSDCYGTAAAAVAVAVGVVVVIGIIAFAPEILAALGLGSAEAAAAAAEHAHAVRRRYAAARSGLFWHWFQLERHSDLRVRRG